MKLKKVVAFILLSSMFLVTLASCFNKEEEITTEEGTNTEEEVVDTWVDQWDEDVIYTGVENDVALDTNGVASDGSIFDSFQHSLFWQIRNADKSYLNLSCTDGVLHMVVPASTLTNARYLQRTITPFDSYEVEFKLRVPYAGWHNGFFIQANYTRTMLHIYENKIRVNNPDDPGNSYKIYADIGTDWHVYRLVNYNGIASLYMDGALLLTFEVNEYPAGEPQMSFYAAAGGSLEDGLVDIDYVSYKNLENKDLRIVSPTHRQILTVGTSVVDAVCAVSDTLKASGKPLEFYLNGVYCGSVDANVAKMTFDSLAAGTYNLQVKCGDVTSEACVFTVERSRTDAQGSSLLSTAQQLQSSYVLRYSVSGDGTVSAGDGMHMLALKYAGNKLTYTSKDGEQTVNGGVGDYIVVVDGGVVWLYKNGKMILSYIMPHGSCGTVAVISGGITGMAVVAHNATLFQKSGADAFSADPGALPSSYALEFEYTKGNEASIVLCDGAYLLSMSIDAEGIARGYVAEQFVIYAPLFEAANGTDFYRIYVSGGLAQIFVNNVWVRSFCLPTTILDRQLSVSGKGLGTVQIRETEDRFFFSADASDPEWAQYFTLDEAGKAYTLKAYAKNATVIATLDAATAHTGVFYLVARYDSLGRGIIAGYDFESKKFLMGTSLTEMTVTGSGVLNEDAELKLVTEGNQAFLYCNGSLVGTLVDPELSGSTDSWHGSETAVNGWGNVGYYSNCANGVLQGFSYEGDGNAMKNATTSYLTSYHTVTVVELGEEIWLCAGTGIPWKSTDNGLTFTDQSHQSVLKGCQANTIVLKSGNILSLVYKKEGSGYIDYAYVYGPDGKTLVSGPFKVQSEPLSYRQTMNGRLMQTQSGRIIFVCGETPNEQTGGFTVYYTDREGYMWKKAKGGSFSLQNAGYALCEGDAVELEPGHLRIFARSELGYLYYCDSYDNGETWNLDELKPSNFPSVSSCFGIDKDPVSGALYMAWEYNNNNDNSTVQYPRSRAGLAVSYDNGVTWCYVGDIDEANHINTGTWLHMNLGVSVTTDAVYVTVAKRSAESENVWYNYIVRVEKSSVVPMVRFNEIHALRNPLENEPAEDATALPLAGTLLISANSKQVYASGDYYEIDEINGKRTWLTAEMIASFMRGSLTYRSSDGAAVITVGTARYVFTPGSDKAIISGEEKSMTFAAVAENGSVKVSVEDLDRVLNLTAKQTASGSIVLSFGHVLLNAESLFANAGI